MTALPLDAELVSTGADLASDSSSRPLPAQAGQSPVSISTANRCRNCWHTVENP